MNIDAIMRYLPHRFPFLLIDRVLDWTAHDSIHAIKNVTLNEPFFIGHFPPYPIMPGVLMIEALAQAGGILLAKSEGWPEEHGEIFFLAGVDNARFKRVVIPGDTLHLKVSVIKQRRDIWKFQGNAYVDDELACSAEIMTIRGGVK